MKREERKEKKKTMIKTAIIDNERNSMIFMTI